MDEVIQRVLKAPPTRYYYALKEKSGKWYTRTGGWTDALSEALLMSDVDNWTPQKGDKIARIEATLREVDDGS